MENLNLYETQPVVGRREVAFHVSKDEILNYIEEYICEGNCEGRFIIYDEELKSLINDAIKQDLRRKAKFTTEKVLPQDVISYFSDRYDVEYTPHKHGIRDGFYTFREAVS